MTSGFGSRWTTGAHGDASTRLRALVALAILSLLASISVVAPNVATRTAFAFADASDGSSRTYFVGDGLGSGTCAAPDFTTGLVYGDDGSDDEAIQAAVNTAASDGTTGVVVIHLCAGSFELSAGISVTTGDDTDYVFEGGDPTDTSATTVTRAGDAPTEFGFFAIDGIPVTFRYLTVSGAAGGTAQDGGAVASDDDVTVSAVVFEDNTTGGAGGAIYTTATVSVSDGTFRRNLADGDGGAIRAGAAASATDGQFIDNSAGASGSGWGGAIYVDNGPVTLLRSTFIGNRAAEYGGAVATNTAGGTVQVVDSAFVGNFLPAGGSGGGAIYAAAHLAASHSSFTDNTAYTDQDGGAIYAEGSADVTASTFISNVARDGGAIYTTAGRVTTTGGTFRGNSAVDYGGAIRADTVVASSGTFADNTVGSYGGAIFAYHGASATDGQFVDNSAGSDGGAICVFDGAVTLQGAVFTGNRAVSYGGAVTAYGLGIGVGTIDATASTFVRNAAGDGAGGALYATESVTAAYSTFRDNSTDSSTSHGGAIFSDKLVAVRWSSFVSNSSGGEGGAIAAGESVDVTASTFVSNVAAGKGGAIRSDEALAVTDSEFTDNSSGSAGGAIASESITLPLAIVRSTFAGNRGVGLGGAVAGDGRVDATNSTFVANVVWSATALAWGGAIHAATDLTATFVTFLDNSTDTAASDRSGGSIYVAAGTATLDHVLVVGSDPSDCGIGTATIVDNGGSIETGESCLGSAPSDPDSRSNQSRSDINLGGFTNHGGLTKTVKLRSPSVALDVSTGPCTVATDQRGAVRPQPNSGDCDAGAFELTSTIVTYTGPSIVFIGTATSARVTLTGTTIEATAGCDLRFTLTGSGGTAYGPYDATTGLKGSGSVLTGLLPVDTYTVVVSPLNDCGGAPDGSGVLAIVPDNIGKGTAGGGSYKVSGFTGQVRFAHVVQVKSTTSKVGRSSVTTVTTKGSLLWTYKNVWRVKARIDYASTDGTTATWGTFTCPPEFSAGSVCGRFSGAALLQSWSDGSDAWVASDYTNVTFTVTVYDGGTKSVCAKNKCSTTTYPDWSGIQVRANGVLLTTTTDGIPVSVPIKLASPYGNGSLKAY